MQQTMRPAAPPTHKAPNAQDKPLALLTNNAVQTSEPFVTPDRMDEVNKEQTKALRQASKNAKKRYAAVAANPADNGVSAFSTEMQNEKATMTQNQDEPAVNIAPKATKRQRQFKASEQRVVICCLQSPVHVANSRNPFSLRQCLTLRGSSKCIVNKSP
jgi:hypothetical protein